MQLFILTTLISFLVAAPSLDGWNDFDHHEGVFGDDYGREIHSQSNRCSNNIKNIGIEHSAIDNSCKNTLIDFGNDDHDGFFHGFGGWNRWNRWNRWPLHY